MAHGTDNQNTPHSSPTVGSHRPLLDHLAKELNQLTVRSWRLEEAAGKAMNLGDWHGALQMLDRANELSTKSQTLIRNAADDLARQSAQSTNLSLTSEQLPPGHRGDAQK